jgi:hypothetical protein
MPCMAIEAQEIRKVQSDKMHDNTPSVRNSAVKDHA